MSPRFSLPGVGGTCDPGVPLDERTPSVESRVDHRLEGVFNHVVKDHIDFGTFENEHHLARGKVGDMTLQSVLVRVERRTLGEELGCLRLRSAL